MNESASRSERALVAQLCQGDARAFAAIMERYMARLILFAHRMVGTRDLAEDIVQNVFIQVWERRTTIDPARPIKSYLFRAVQNRALNERKAARVRDQYRQWVQEAAEAGIISGIIPSPEGDILTATAVWSAMAQLPERRRLALQLRLEELTHAEIGEVLGLSPLAAQSLVARAIASLRDRLERS